MIEAIVIAGATVAASVAIFKAAQWLKYRGNYGHSMPIPDIVTTNGIPVHAMHEVKLEQEHLEILAREAKNPRIASRFRGNKKFSQLVVGGCRIIFTTQETTIYILGISVVDAGQDLQDALEHIEHAGRFSRKTILFLCAGNPDLRQLLIKRRGYTKKGHRSELAKSF